MENTLLLREYVPPEILERMGPEMADRFIKRRRSSTCNAPNQQQLHISDQQQPQSYANANTLSVPMLASDQPQPRLVNAVEQTPIVGASY